MTRPYLSADVEQRIRQAAALHLDDDPDALIVRSYWVMAGWHPPQE